MFGAAITAYKVIWNYLEQCANVLLHLGGFHVMKENIMVDKLPFLGFHSDVFRLIQTFAHSF